MDDQIITLENNEQMINSLSSLCEMITNNNFLGFAETGPMISQTDTQFYNLRWYLISNLRQLLSQMYVEHGIVQTLIDQPVDDAFRAGFEVKSGQLDGDDIEELMICARKHKLVDRLKQAIKWGRLYGGGGVLIITPQNPESPLNIARIGPDTPLEFRSADMWEFFFYDQNVAGDLAVGMALGANMGEFYDYYGKRVHHSRVVRFVGKEPPAFIKPRLRGWGMSEVERLVRSLNQYLKNQDVIFELLDEAKVDVYKIKGFNSGLLNAQGTAKVAARIQAANQIKNFNSALTMDLDDDYIQKQINFTGLNDMLLQIRQGIAADLKMPMTKLFGISAAGFNSGEDDIENYNAMIESEIRSKCESELISLLQVCCQKVFGRTIPDLQVTFNPLRILNAKEEEEVKDSQYNRVMSSYQSGLIEAKEAKEAINKDSLLPVEIDPNAPASEPIGGEFEVAGGAKGKAGKKTPDQE